MEHIFDVNNLDMIMDKLKSTPEYVEAQVIEDEVEVGEEPEEEDDEEDESE